MTTPRQIQDSNRGSDMTSDSSHDIPPSRRPDTVPNRAPRSCQQCNRRKVRCDKRDPCSACQKAGQACAYPPRGPRRRRTKAALHADIASRMSELEKTLSNVTSGTLNHALSTSSHQTRTESPQGQGPISQLRTDPPPKEQYATSEPNHQTDVLVQAGSASRYFSDIILSKVINEEKHHVRNAFATPSTNASPSAHKGPSPFNPLGILSVPDTVRLPHTYHPAKDIAASLWKQYVDVVDECTSCKVLHVPTDEITVFSVIEDPSSTEADDLALCFAIYFAACASMQSGEIDRTLRQDNVQGMLTLKRGLEQALAHSDFLDRPSETTIKALAIYLAALRTGHRGKGTWMVNGLAKRAACSLGLNVDGKRLGLSPFRAEMRRRVWWCLHILDSRANEDFGLPGLGDIAPSRSVDLPMNVGDGDLHPDMTTMPQSRTGWTSMTPTLINIEVFRALTDLTEGSSNEPPLEETRHQIMERARSTIRRYTQQAKLVVPRQRHSTLVSQLVLKKLDFISRLQFQLRRTETPGDAFVTEANMSEALEVLELARTLSTDDLLKKYAASSKAYPQNSVMLYVLYHLCVKPLDPNSERAWELLHAGSASWGGLDIAGIGPKAEILETLLNKAKDANAAALAEQSGQSVGIREEGWVSSYETEAGLQSKEGYPEIDVDWTLPWLFNIDGPNNNLWFI